MTVEVRVCRPAEIGRVKTFLHEHWAADHVLSWHQPLLDFQHFDAARDRYDFVLALQGEELLGVLGFIPTRLYDPALEQRSTCWVALWKVREDCGVAGLGLRMLGALRRAEPHEAMAVIGIGNDEHPAMYRALGFTSGAYRQHFVTRPSAGLKIARIPDGAPRPVPAAGRARLSLLSEGDLAALDGLDLGERAAQSPAKSPEYFRRRFLAHPVYAYQVHLVTLEGAPRGLLASRVAEAESQRALRIVDYWGASEALSECGTALGEVLEATDCEYADLWEHGLPAEVPARVGLQPVELGGPIIVPNYFEPFEPRNGRILFAYRGSAAPVLFRADGDQDRPSRPPRTDA